MSSFFNWLSHRELAAFYTLLLDLNRTFWFISFLIFQLLFAIPSNFISIFVILQGCFTFIYYSWRWSSSFEFFEHVGYIVANKRFSSQNYSDSVATDFYCCYLIGISLSRIRWNNARCSWNPPPAQATQETLAGKL
jgi:hypothetical protein